SAQLTFNSGANQYPVWSPDGKTIVYTSNHAGHFDLYEKPADGSGEEREVLKTEHNKYPSQWSQDGHFLLYTDVDTKTGNDIWILPMTGDRKAIPFLRTNFDEFDARVSPDGRWIGYTSNESGGIEMYVRPFAPDARNEATAGGKWMIS